jgi:hypothetical protein
MSATGKNTQMIRKKDLAQQNLPSVAVTKLVFKHKAVGGETGFNLLSLTAPPEQVANGFVQPSTAKLTTARLLENRNNLVLRSSVRGVLDAYSSYAPTTGTQITFSAIDFGTALPGEIFTGELTPILSTGAVMVDSDPISYTGTLLAGQTDFVVGQVWEGGKFVTLSQMGAVLVIKDGFIQYRNVGNAAAGVGVDGDYQELSTNGLANTIRFNTADDKDTVVSVLSIGHTAFRPNESILAVTDNLAGQLQLIINLLIATSGAPASYFQQQVPSAVDLTTFGAAVYAAQTAIVALQTTATALQTRDNLLESPTLQSDVVATRLGQKTYRHGTTYNGGVAPTVTLSSGATLTSVDDSSFIPYQMQDGVWRLKFMITAALNGASIVTANFLINSVAIGGTAATIASGSGQAFAAWSRSFNVATYGANARADNNTFNIQFGASTGVISIILSGDIYLASKPTWAY